MTPSCLSCEVPAVDKRIKPETYGERLALAMHKRGMTCETLGAAIHCHPSSIGNYIHDKRSPDIAIARDICKTLHVSMDWMCGLRD